MPYCRHKTHKREVWGVRVWIECVDLSSPLYSALSTRDKSRIQMIRQPSPREHINKEER